VRQLGAVSSLSRRILTGLAHAHCRYFRPAEVELLWGDCTKAETKLGWKRHVDFDGLVKEMVESDIKGECERMQPYLSAIQLNVPVLPTQLCPKESRTRTSRVFVNLFQGGCRCLGRFVFRGFHFRGCYTWLFVCLQTRNDSCMGLKIGIERALSYQCVRSADVC
jgi:hypothetical protein